MMNCSNCGHEVPADAAACPFCGIDLVTAARSVSQPAEDDDLQGVVVGLQTQIGRLQAQVNRQAQRIYALETAQSRLPSETPAAAAVDPSGSPAQVIEEAGTAPPPRTDAGAAAPVDGKRWEWLIGGNWLARVGALALIIGIGFFLKLALDNEWSGETTQVILGLAVGVSLLVGGEYWGRRYPAWAQAVTGGGIAILYLAVYAASALYSLIPPGIALALSVLATLSAASLAFRYNAQSVAILGLLGGIATPLLLAGTLPNQWTLPLLYYVLILDLGVLALTVFRNWRWFTLLALLGSLGLFGSWYFTTDPGLELAQVGNTFIFLIFAGATTLFFILRGRAPGRMNGVLIVLNGVTYFGISYLLLMDDEYRAWLGGLAFLLALFYGFLGYWIPVRHRGPERFNFPAMGLGLVFLIVTVPILVSGPWVAVIWAVQALVFVGLSSFRGMHQLTLPGLAVFALIVLRLVGYSFVFPLVKAVFSDSDGFLWSAVNRNFLEGAVVVAAMALSAYFRRRDQEYRLVYPLLLVMANGVSLFVLSIGIIDIVGQAFADIEPETAGNVLSLSLSAFWALYAAALIVLGVARRSLRLRQVGLGLLAVPIVKLFVYDAFSLEQEYRVIIFIGLGILLVLGGFMYQRYGRIIRDVLLE